MTLEGTNTYVVDAGETLRDRSRPGGRAAPRGGARGGGRGGIAGVLLTHSHADHSAGVEMLGAPVLWGTVGASDELSDPLGGAGERRRHRIASARSSSSRPPATPPTTSPSCFGPVCFCGDLVLGEGSTIVPPGGGGARRLPRVAGAPVRARLRAPVPGPRTLGRRSAGEDRRVPRPPARPGAQAAGCPRKGRALAAQAARRGLERRARGAAPGRGARDGGPPREARGRGPAAGARAVAGAYGEIGSA